jgi:uncharacterized Zn-finger protein
MVFRHLAVQGLPTVTRLGRLAMVHQQTFREGFPMAEHIIPHFHNDPGVPVIEIGAKEFMCVGATPPFDHPHVFLDMGEDNEIICPYCSTLYRHDPSLNSHAARPVECALPLTAAA